MVDTIHQHATKEQTNQDQLGRLMIIDQLKNTAVGISHTMQKLILNGIAYHHAGLTVDERKIIEQGFRNGSISILATTSTLAAGVNLPAHRVIIREPKMGGQDLTVAAFRQVRFQWSLHM
jgi:replicative superfamily II helicase